MKKTIVIASVSLIIISCNNKTETTGSAAKDTTTAVTPAEEKIDYAYLPANHSADNWDRGDQKNIAIVLKSLKGFENGNVDEALAAFADSVRWTTDGYDEKLSKEGLRKAFTDAWANMSSLKIMMEDYEAVVSKDKKDNWVSLWYKQISTDKKGKTDSAFYMDDVKLENGKIVVLDEKLRKYPAPKK